MANTKTTFTALDRELLREAAANVELGDLDAFSEDFPDFLAFLLRSFANDRPIEMLNYRALQLARSIVETGD